LILSKSKHFYLKRVSRCNSDYSHCSLKRTQLTYLKTMSYQTTIIRLSNRLSVNTFFLLLLLAALPMLGQGQKTDEIQTLPPNQKLESTLKGGEAHSYRVMLKAGEYFHVDVEQRGIDVVLSMISPDGKVLVERDRPNGVNGQESLSLIVITNGKYQLDVKTLDEEVQIGEYGIKSETRRTPSVQDKKRIEAENLFWEGSQLARKNTLEAVQQVSPKYERAIVLWQDTGDKYAEALTLTQLGFISESLRDYQKAAATQERALSLYKELKDSRGIAITSLALGRLSSYSGETKKTLAYYDEALSLWRAMHDKLEEAGTLNTIGAIYLNSEDAKKAIDYYNQALPLWRETKKPAAEAEVLCTIGRAYFDLGEIHKGIDSYKQSLPLWKQVGNKAEEAKTLNNIGVGHIYLGDKQKTLDYYNQALSISREIRDPTGEAETLSAIGRVYLNSGETQKGLDYLNQVLPLRKASSDLRGEADTLSSIAEAYLNSGEAQKAIDYYNQSLPLWTKVDDKEEAAMTLSALGVGYSYLEENQKALDYYEQALTLSRSIEYRRGEAVILNGIGNFYLKIGENQKALNHYNQALPLWKAIDDKRGEVATLNLIGGVYFNSGENQNAIDYYKQALSILKAVTDRGTEILTYNNLGTAYYLSGEFKEAFNYFSLALTISQATEDKLSQAILLTHTGALYSKLGDFQKASDYYNQALSLYKELEVKTNLHNTLVSIGILNIDRDNQKALDYFDQALVLVKASKLKREEASILESIGKVYSSKGDTEKTLDYFNQALSMSRAVRDKRGEAGVLHNMALEYEKSGNQQKALDYYNQALLLWKMTGDKYTEVGTLNNIMAVRYGDRVSRFAAFYGKQSINSIQSLRENIQGIDRDQRVEGESQRTFLKYLEPIYRNLASFLIEQGRLAEAHQVLNTFKDQQYFDFNPKTTKKPLALTLTQREKNLDAQYTAASDKISNIGGQMEKLKRLIGNGTPSSEESLKLQQLESSLKAATDEFLALLKQAEAEFAQPPDKVNDKEPKIDDTREMQQALQALGKKTVAVYTLVQNDKFYALIITPDDIMAVSSPITADSLNNKAKQLWALLQSDEYDPKILSKEIYDLVFKPIKDKLIKQKKLEKVLPEGATILWSLDSNLRYLPMAALYDGEKYLVEHYNNVVFTRAETGHWTRNISPHWTGVGFGSSRGGDIEYLKLVYPFADLPNAIKELNAVFRTNDSKSGVFEGDILPDLKFTREAMIAALKQHRPLVHIASHFKFAPGNEARSFLLLGDRTVFPLNEMKQQANLFQGVELLTLSACETGAQWANSDGREVDGFAELAQRLGAEAVMATLWNVKDDSSYWLMRDFYQRKQDVSKQTKAESLRQAQLGLLRGTAQVTPSTQSGNTNVKNSGGNSIAIKILSAGKELPQNIEDGVVYVEAKYAKPYNRSDSKPYAHPYFWSPFILFGNWQ
jgi:CHAT domain-containing protein/Tfp pilus assembly protein PilF